MKNKIFDISQYMNKTTQINSQASEKITMISVYNIEPHPANQRMSMPDLEILSAQIEFQGGVREPLIVKKIGDGEYVVISGHRRRAAMLILLENKSDIITSPLVPCIIREYQSIEEEQFEIGSANSYRDLTLRDKEIAIELKLPFAKIKYGEAQKAGIKLGKFRSYFAQTLGISSSELQRIESLKNLAPELRQEIDDGNLDITPASMLSSLDQKKQKEIFCEVQDKYGKVTGKAIQSVKKAKEQKDKVDFVPELDKKIEDVDYQKNLETKEMEVQIEQPVTTQSKISSDDQLHSKQVENEQQEISNEIPPTNPQLLQFLNKHVCEIKKNGEISAWVYIDFNEIQQFISIVGADTFNETAVGATILCKKIAINLLPNGIFTYLSDLNNYKSCFGNSDYEEAVIEIEKVKDGMRYGEILQDKT